MPVFTSSRHVPTKSRKDMHTRRLSWLPNETVFSYCSRWHAISGHTAAHQTSRDIFQHDQVGTAHDLPTRLNYFAARFDNELGVPEEIAVKHTIVPYFLPFLSDKRRKKALRVMCGEEKAHLKYHLGILTSNQGASHPLKFCPHCVEQDTENYGTSYWHITHQLPGSAICLTHQRPLIVATDKVSGKRRFHWLLPSEAHHNCSEYDPTDISLQTSALQNVIHDFFAAGCLDDYSNHQRVSQTNLRQLLQKGFGSKRRPQSLDWNQTSKAFLSWLSHLDQCSYIDFIPDTVKKASLLLQRNLITRGSNTHPLNRLLFITWAFSSWANFEDKYAEPAKPEPQQVAKPESEAENPYSLKRAQAVKLLATGKSARSVSTRIGVDTQTVICWGRAAGCDIEKKPQQGKIADISLAKLLLSEGAEKQDIESKTSLSRTTINRILRCDTHLSQCWNEQRNQRLLEKNRSIWSELSRSNPTFSTKQIRFINPSVYAWLYRNDRDWLLTQNIATNTGKIGNNSAINWDERDLDYAKKVKETALQFYQAHPGEKLARNVLLRGVPGLTKKLKHLNRLPKTKSALFEALKQQRTYSGFTSQISFISLDKDKKI